MIMIPNDFLKKNCNGDGLHSSAVVSNVPSKQEVLGSNPQNGLSLFCVGFVCSLWELSRCSGFLQHTKRAQRGTMTEYIQDGFFPPVLIFLECNIFGFTN